MSQVSYILKGTIKKKMFIIFIGISKDIIIINNAILQKQKNCLKKN